MKTFNKNEKLLKWKTSDYIANAIVYLLNVVLIIGMFYSFNYMGSWGKSMAGYKQDVTSVIRFSALLIITIGVFFTYFYFEDRDFLKNSANSEMIFLIIEIAIAICYPIGGYFNIFLRPFALPALLVLFLVNRRSAIFANIIFCILVFIGDNFSGVDTVASYYSFFICFSSGMLAIFCTNKDFSRIKLLCLSWVISLPSLLCAVLFLLTFGFNGSLMYLLLSACAGPLSVMAFMILLPIMETLFQKLSSFKLAELTDHKAKLIRRLISEAPGTFNHSIVVSNIAEACATAIGEDALLARTCAYYHDIGKLRRPEFFGENQVDGNNPHNELMPELSASIIKSHVQDGYQLVLKSGLPKVIADVCLEHHGTMPILYFYSKAKKFTDGEVDIKDFCYAGPKPQSKIAAIIMIADGCEAAARSLKNRSRENVLTTVKKIVNDRMELGQFDECEITIKELNLIINTVVNNLTGIYHSRVEYPKLNLSGMHAKKED